jgi:putative two-component system response regulator
MPDDAEHGMMASSEGPTPQILVVDDEPGVSLLLREMLAAEGYDVVVASDGLEALACVGRRCPDLIFLDLDLPRLDGFEVCRRLKRHPATRLVPVIIITGQTTCTSRLTAWDLGADDFLSKPFHEVEVLARTRSLLRIKRLIDERDSAAAVVFALARTIEAKSPYTHGHSERVRDYALHLAARIGVSEHDREVLRKGALLHDIGKIRIPDALLNKPGALTEEEFEVIKEHPRQGAHIVAPLRSLQDTIPLIRWHHERLDGRGYPDGLAGRDIPLLVRVLSVADVYDALASARPYRPPMRPADCLRMLQENAADGGLDPELVDLFCEIAREAVRERDEVVGLVVGGVS